MNRLVWPLTCWTATLCITALLVPSLLGQEIARKTTPAAQTAAPALDDFASDNSTSTHDARQMHIVLLADDKDHGPAGNGLHDYPLWQKRWTRLLSGKKGSAGAPGLPESPGQADTVSTGGATTVTVTTAWHWPSDAQFQAADVIVAYCYLDWTEDRIAQVRRYLQQGGGLVLIHSATWTKPGPSPDVAGAVGVGGFRKYRHGPVRLDIAARKHPICSGLPATIELDDDETYWPPTPMSDSVTVLATSLEAPATQDSAQRAAQPMFWCYEVGQGRVFGCVPGHRAKTFDNPMFRTLLLRGIAWSANESPGRLDALAKTQTDTIQ